MNRRRNLSKETSKKKLLNVYFGTRGSTASSYLKELQSSQQKYVETISLVNYYSDVPNGKRCVYYISDHPRIHLVPKYIRNFIRYIELVIGFLILFVIAIRNEITHINYSITVYLRIEYYFFKLLSVLLPRISIIITMHDANLHWNAFVKGSSRQRTRKRVFGIADYIVVHNTFSERFLVNLGIPNAKIVSHLFPPMGRSAQDFTNIGHNYLFIGHARREKGVDFLCNAWYNEEFEDNRKLNIYGSDPSGLLKKLAQDMVKNESIKIYSDYVSDEEFYKLIQRSKYLVLPYLVGTNSGFPFFALSKNTLPLMSDIPAFHYFSSQYPGLVFRINDTQDLVDKLKNVRFSDYDCKQILHKYIEDYEKSVKLCYNSLFN